MAPMRRAMEGYTDGSLPASGIARPNRLHPDTRRLAAGRFDVGVATAWTG
jgi:hypothetical protein